MLSVLQYSVHILYKPGSKLYIANCLFHENLTENRDQENMGINVTIHALSTAVEIPISTSIESIQAAISQDVDLERLKAYIIRG